MDGEAPRISPDLAVALDAVREVQKRHPFQFVLQGHLFGGRVSTKWLPCLGPGFGQPLFDTPLGKIESNISWIKLRGQSGTSFIRMFQSVSTRKKVCDLKLDIGVCASARRPIQSP